MLADRLVSAIRGWLIVGLVAVGGDEVFLGMMVSRSAEITGVSGATLVSPEITGCITCNACES